MTPRNKTFYILLVSSLIISITIIILSVIVLAMYVSNWNEFSYVYLDLPRWVNLEGKKTKDLRFRTCLFTINYLNDYKPPYTRDVTGVLTRMIYAYRNNESETEMSLVGPLTVNSFL